MGKGAKRPKKFFRTWVRNCFASTLFAPTPLFVFLHLDLIQSVVGMKRCKKDNFVQARPTLRVGAKIKGGCKAPKRPTLYTPKMRLFKKKYADNLRHLTSYTYVEEMYLRITIPDYVKGNKLNMYVKSSDRLYLGK